MRDVQGYGVDQGAREHDRALGERIDVLCPYAYWVSLSVYDQGEP